MPDEAVVLRDRATRLAEELVQAADRETFLMLNPLFARPIESPAAHRVFRREVQMPVLKRNNFVGADKIVAASSPPIA